MAEACQTPVGNVGTCRRGETERKSRYPAGEVGRRFTLRQLMPPSGGQVVADSNPAVPTQRTSPLITVKAEVSGLTCV